MHIQTFLFVQNAHAYVNAGFYMEVDTTNYTVKGKPSLVFGGISTHGVSTQTYLLFVLEPGFLFWILILSKAVRQNLEQIVWVCC